MSERLFRDVSVTKCLESKRKRLDCEMLCKIMKNATQQFYVRVIRDNVESTMTFFCIASVAYLAMTPGNLLQHLNLQCLVFA
jgi:hypothetical protein